MKIVVRKHVKEYSENKNIYKTRKTTKILASIIYKIEVDILVIILQKICFPSIKHSYGMNFLFWKID